MLFDKKRAKQVRCRGALWHFSIFHVHNVHAIASVPRTEKKWEKEKRKQERKVTYTNCYRFIAIFLVIGFAAVSFITSVSVAYRMHIIKFRFSVLVLNLISFHRISLRIISYHMVIARTITLSYLTINDPCWSIRNIVRHFLIFNCLY